jgi:hypothetical protein
MIASVKDTVMVRHDEALIASQPVENGECL